MAGRLPGAQPGRQPRRRVRLLGGRRQRDRLGRRVLALPAVGLPWRDARRLWPRLAHRLRGPRALLRDQRGRDGHVRHRRGPDRAADVRGAPAARLHGCDGRALDRRLRAPRLVLVGAAPGDRLARLPGPACATNNGHCTYGCPTGALATPANAYWPEALRNGVRLQTGARVREITLDTRGRADGVLYHAPDGSVQRATAPVVVLAGKRAGHAAAAAHVVVARLPRRAGELQRHGRPQPHGPRADDGHRALPGAHGRRPWAVGRDGDDAPLLRNRPVPRLQARVHHHGDARVRRARHRVADRELGRGPPRGAGAPPQPRGRVLGLRRRRARAAQPRRARPRAHRRVRAAWRRDALHAVGELAPYRRGRDREGDRALLRGGRGLRAGARVRHAAGLAPSGHGPYGIGPGRLGRRRMAPLPRRPESARRRRVGDGDGSVRQPRPRAGRRRARGRRRPAARSGSPAARGAR